MKKGHILSLIGAVMAVVGATALPWQHFVTADITTPGYMVPPAGQIVLALAALMALTAILGIVTRKRREWATATLIISVFAIAWAVAAHVSRAASFELMKYETVQLMTGYYVAAWGVFIAFLGSLVVFASEPSMDPDSEFLRVALLWNGTDLQDRLLQEPQTFTVGEDIRNDIVLPAEALPAQFPLFRANRKGHYSIGISKDLEGQITLNQETQDIQEFRKKASETSGGLGYVDIGPGDWGIIHIGEFQIFFQFVKPEGKAARKGILAFDEYVASSIAISALLQLLFVGYSATAGWQETAERQLRAQKEKKTDIKVILKDEEPEEILPEDEEQEEDTTAKKAEGEEGKFGDPDEDPEKDSKVPKNDGKMVDKIDPKKVGLNDLLSTNKLGGSGAIANILSSNTEGFSNKIAVAMAGSGSEFVMGHGAGGMGFQGTGSGGGGEGGYGRIHGMGKIDTGGGMGVKAGLGKKKKRRVGKIKLGGSSTRGFCKKSNISSVVRRRAGAIRACYEKRLQVKPNLSGKLNARWTIATDGRVQGVSASGSMSDGTVKNCVLRVLRRMRFAKPEGGICVVQWPFVFSSSG